jgi:hypothetical protein
MKRAEACFIKLSTASCLRNRPNLKLAPNPPNPHLFTYPLPLQVDHHHWGVQKGCCCIVTKTVAHLPLDLAKTALGGLGLRLASHHAPIDAYEQQLALWHPIHDARFAQSKGMRPRALSRPGASASRTSTGPPSSTARASLDKMLWAASSQRCATVKH